MGIQDTKKVDCIVKCAYDKLLPLETLHENPLNPNKHTPEQITLLAKIMRISGVRKPITVSNRSGFITIGHARRSAALENGWTEYPVDLQDYKNEAEEYADMVADNKIAELATSDMKMIEEDARRLQEEIGDFDLLGIPDFVLPEDAEAENERADEIPTDVESVCKLGDLWQLGEHRLLCGDCTDSKLVDILMGGEKANMVFTDPPYNQNFSGGIDKHGNKSASGSNVTIKNDNMSQEEYKVFCEKFFEQIKRFSSGGWYVCFYRKEMLSILNASIETGLAWRSIIVWKKNRPALSPLDYHNNFEPILYGYESHDWYGGKDKSDVWEFPRPYVNDLHPTMKPVEMIETAIRNSSVSNGKVFDLFLGSGSTLIACEKTKRKCMGCEIDPHYCDVIIKRWEDFTGNKAIKLDSIKNTNATS